MCIRDRLHTLLNTGPVGPADDYVVVQLQDKGPVHEPMARLREIYPNALHIERTQAQASAPGRFAGRDHRVVDLQSHFSDFFSAVTGEPMSADESALLHTLLGHLDAEETSA